MAQYEPNAIVTQRIEVTPQLIKLRVVPDGWELPHFEAGQYCVLGLPGSAPRCELASQEDPSPDPEKLIRRAYSVASSSADREYVEFYVGLVHSGALSPRLLTLRAGDSLYMANRFRGLFTLAEVHDELGVVLAATGTGVAPYMSMIRTEVKKGVRHRFAVIHGARHSCELGYQDELKSLSAASESFDYFPVLSHSHEERIPWKGLKGFIQDIWISGLPGESWLSKITPDNTHVFLCGNPLMINAMTEVLEGEGFGMHSKKSPGQIHVEKFFVKL